MANSEENKQAFLEYLTRKRPDVAGDIYSTFEIVDAYIKISYKIPYKSLYDVLDITAINKLQKTLTNDGSFMYTNRKIQRFIALGFKLLKEYIIVYLKKSKPTNHTDGIAIERSENMGALSSSKESNYSEYIRSKQKVKENKLNQIDFDNIVDITYTRPIEFKYDGFIINDATTWTKLYVHFMEYMLNVFPERFRSGQIIGFGSRIDIGDNYQIQYMVKPKRISGHYYLELNYNARDICKKIGAVLKLCNIKYDEVILTYEGKNNTSSAFKQNSIIAKTEITENYYSDSIGKLPQISDKPSFKEWLIEKEIVSEEYTEKFIQHIKLCDLYLHNEFAYPTGLEDIKIYKELLRVQKLLNEDYSFKKISKRKHDYPLFALNKYVEYREDIIVSDCASVVLGVNANNTGSDDTKKKINDILKEEFKNGYRPGNYMHQIRFIDKYKDLFGEKINEDKLDNVIKQYGRIVDDRVFATDDNSTILDAICNDIIQTFENGASVMYWSCIYEKYSSILNQNNIYSSDALRRLLITEKKLRCSYNEKMIYVDKEHYYEIRRLITNSYSPVKIEEIQEKLWYMPLDVIKTNIRALDKVVLTDNAYFYAPNFQISTEESEALVNAMHKAISEKGSIVKNEILNIIQKNCPFAYVEALKFKDYAIRNIIGIIYGDLFGVSRSAITEKGVILQYGEMFEQFANERESFSLTELRKFKMSRNAPTIYWDRLYRCSVRVSEDEFVKKSNIQFNVEQIDDVLDKMCVSDYMPIKDVILYLAFPNVGYIWNKFLLESYVRQYSRKFRLIQLTPTLNDALGAIVKQSSNYTTYSDVIADYLANNPELWNDEKSAIECIVKAGFQNNNTYSNISQVLKLANKIMDDEG